MSTPTSRAGLLRGGFVGSCSVLVTILAHAAGGGDVPMGSALVLLVLVCATVGAGVATVELSGRYARLGLIIVALSAGQALGHLTLALAGGHHHSGSILQASPPMLVLHVIAAIVLGLLIGVFEYLYVVSSSLLCWLRLFATDVHSPAVARVRHRLDVVVVRRVLPCAGLGMRAPPRPSILGA